MPPVDKDTKRPPPIDLKKEAVKEATRVKVLQEVQAKEKEAKRLKDLSAKKALGEQGLSH